MADRSISILIVHWNVWPLLQQCLRSIEQHSQPDSTQNHSRLFGPADRPIQLEVIVVDNASQDTILQELPQQFAWVQLIASQANLGFTRGNNLAYAQSQGDFVFFLNPDTEIIDPDSLWKLYTMLDSNPNVGMVGPQLRYGDHSWQNNRRRFPTRWTGYWESTWLGRCWPNNPWARQMHMADCPADQPHEVDWLMGSAMLTRRATIEEIAMAQGPFDENFFMYSEELDLCHRIKDAGWQIFYLPDALILHHEGRSSTQVVAARHIYFNSSKVRYYSKYFGAGWAELLRRYLMLEFYIQKWLEQIKGLLVHKRALRAARVVAYQQVIDSGLRN